MAQSTPVGQRSALPAEIHQLAATYHLGTPLTLYKGRFLGIFLFGLIIGLLGLFCLIAAFSGGFNIYLLIFALAFLIYSAWRILVAFAHLNSRAYLCTDGLMKMIKGASPEQVEAVRWDQTKDVWKIYVVSIWATMFRFMSLFSTNPTYVSSWATLQRYRLTSTDGKEIEIEKAYSKFKQLGKVIEQTMLNRMLPQAWQAYNAGQIVQFGPVAISQQGITLSEGGQESMAWSEINHVGLSSGSAIFNWKKPGKVLASNRRIDISKIPNVFVLQEMVKQIRTAQKQNKR